MKVKQQKQIQAFLAERFGQEKGNALFARQEEALRQLIDGIKDKSESQRKTLIQRIFPCIALYRALTDSGIPEQEAYTYLQRYMQENVAAKQHASMVRMELVPGFYTLYSAIFRKVMRSSDRWESTQSHTKRTFDVTIRKCLWHTACTESGCAQLCRLFCDVDNVSYGGLRKIGFARTQTLGYGGSCCDFHFFQK